jgi:tetratricopeptide (TPR) repeat protein
MLGNPAKFSSQDRGWLRAVLDRYPHSSIINVLALLADHAHGFDTPEQRRAAMLAMCDSAKLDDMLNRAASANEAPSYDIFSEINTFQEVSFKTAPKSVILSNFLNAGPAEDVQKAQEAPVPEVHDDKKSIQPDEILGTETLAVILEDQGRYEQALAIYKNLLAHNPEKSSNFAARISRLETLIKGK